MAGKIKKMIDTIVDQRSKGSPAIINLTRAKLSMKGIIYSKYDEKSEDDSAVIQKLVDIAKELNINL